MWTVPVHSAQCGTGVSVLSPVPNLVRLYYLDSQGGRVRRTHQPHAPQRGSGADDPGLVSTNPARSGTRCPKGPRTTARPKHPLRNPPTVLLLLYDQDYKAWCHGGHGTSCGPCVDTVLTAHASPRRLRRGTVDILLRIVLVTRKPFPKGCHLFGRDGRQAGTTTITDLQFR